MGPVDHLPPTHDGAQDHLTWAVGLAAHAGGAEGKLARPARRECRQERQREGRLIDAGPGWSAW
jgi:hypothetical protein